MLAEEIDAWLKRWKATRKHSPRTLEFNERCSKVWHRFGHRPVSSLRRAAVEEPLGSAWLALALVPAAAALVVSGTLVTAAGPHSGGEEIVRFGNLVEAVHIHIGATAVFGIAFLALLALLVAERRRARVELGLAATALALLLAQMVVGEIQWQEALPWSLVLVHVTLATAIWAATVWLVTLLWRPSASTARA